MKDIPILETCSKSGIADVGRTSAKLKWKWAGHILITQDRWARVITQCLAMAVADIDAFS